MEDLLVKCNEDVSIESVIDNRRKYGVHLTPINIFDEFIKPRILEKLYDHIWTDLFCGEGNLILPILSLIPSERRKEFFEKRIFLYDLQDKMVERAVENSTTYGIPRKLAEKNIMVMDTLEQYPEYLIRHRKNVYHITNPPYLYLGYISKNKATSSYLNYFRDGNRGFQDLYQVAMINDLRNDIDKMAYIIPSNFLFGSSVSNFIRRSFLQDYNIEEAVVFEEKIFSHTGTNVILCFFKRSEQKNHSLSFKALKIGYQTKERYYTLSERYGFRAGEEFEEYINNNGKNNLRVTFYLTLNEIESNMGNNRVVLLNSKSYSGGKYRKEEFYVNDSLYSRIKSNPLFIRTLDTGSLDGKAGLYSIGDEFGVDGIYVSGNTYRTSPIQIFLDPVPPVDKIEHVRLQFNKILNELREKTDSEFMTTYKYSENGQYTRKYLGLSQARKILGTIKIN